MPLDRSRRVPICNISFLWKCPSRRPLEIVHARLQIENRHFDAFPGHVRAVLDDLGTSEELGGEIVYRVASIRAVVVNAEAASA